MGKSLSLKYNLVFGLGLLLAVVVASSSIACSEAETAGIVATLEGSSQSNAEQDQGNHDADNEAEKPPRPATIDLVMKGELVGNEPQTYQLLSRDIKIRTQKGLQVKVLVDGVELTNFEAAGNYQTVQLPMPKSVAQELTFQLFKDDEKVLDRSMQIDYHPAVSRVDESELPADRPDLAGLDNSLANQVYIRPRLLGSPPSDPSDSSRLLFSNGIPFVIDDFFPKTNVTITFLAHELGSPIAPTGLFVTDYQPGEQAFNKKFDIGATETKLPEDMVYFRDMSPGDEPIRLDLVFRISHTNDQQEVLVVEHKIAVTRVAPPTAPSLGATANFSEVPSGSLPLFERHEQTSRGEVALQADGNVEVFLWLYVGDESEDAADLVLHASSRVPSVLRLDRGLTAYIATSFFSSPRKKVRLVAVSRDVTFGLRSESNDFVFIVDSSGVLASLGADRLQLLAMNNALYGGGYTESHTVVSDDLELTSLDVLLVKGLAGDLLSYAIRGSSGEVLLAADDFILSPPRGNPPGNEGYIKIPLAPLSNALNGNEQLLFTADLRAEDRSYIGRLEQRLNYVELDLAFEVFQAGIDGTNPTDPTRRLVKDDFVVRASHSLSNYGFVTVHETINADGNTEPKPDHFLLVYKPNDPDFDFYGGLGFQLFRAIWIGRHGFGTSFGAKGAYGISWTGDMTNRLYKILPKLPKGHPPLDLGVRFFAHQSNGSMSVHSFDDVNVTMVAEPLPPSIVLSGDTGNGSMPIFRRRAEGDKVEFTSQAAAHVDVWFAVYFGNVDLDDDWLTLMSTNWLRAGDHAGSAMTNRISASYFTDHRMKVRVVAKSVGLTSGLESEEADLVFEVRTENFLYGNPGRLVLRVQSHPTDYGTDALDGGHPLLTASEKVSSLDAILARGKLGDLVVFALANGDGEVIADGSTTLRSKPTSDSFAYGRIKLNGLSSLEEAQDLALKVTVKNASLSYVGGRQWPLNVVVYDFDLAAKDPGIDGTNAADPGRFLVKNDLILQGGYSPEDASLVTMHEVRNDAGNFKPQPDHFLLVNKEANPDPDLDLDFYDGMGYHEFNRVMRLERGFLPYEGVPDAVIGRSLADSRSNLVYKILPKLPDGHKPVNVNVRFYLGKNNGARIRRRLEDLRFTMVARPLPPVIELQEDTGAADGETSKPALKLFAAEGHAVDYKVTYNVAERDSDSRLLTGTITGLGRRTAVPLDLREIAKMASKEGLRFEVAISATSRSEFGLRSERGGLEFVVLPEKSD